MDSIVYVNLLTLAAGAETKSFDLSELLSRASGVALVTLGVLILFSIGSWYVIGYKWLHLRRAQRESEEFLETFWQSKRLDTIFQTSEHLQRSPISQVFRAGYIELTKLKQSEQEHSMRAQLGGTENIERASMRAQTGEVTNLERLVPFLGTTAATTPLIGLFGTVWGIMNSFINIGAEESVSLATVAPGIAEALVSTAFGLMAAIPAVIFYNYFLNRIRILSSEMESFSNDFLNIIKRHFLK